MKNELSEILLNKGIEGVIKHCKEKLQITAIVFLLIGLVIGSVGAII